MTLKKLEMDKVFKRKKQEKEQKEKRTGGRERSGQSGGRSGRGGRGRGGRGPDSKCMKHPDGNHQWKDCRLNPRNQNGPYPFQGGRGRGSEGRGYGGRGGFSGRNFGGRGPPPRDAYFQQFSGLPPSDTSTMGSAPSPSPRQEPWDSYTNQPYQQNQPGIHYSQGNIGGW